VPPTPLLLPRRSIRRAPAAKEPAEAVAAQAAVDAPKGIGAITSNATEVALPVKGNWKDPAIGSARVGVVVIATADDVPLLFVEVGNRTEEAALIAAKSDKYARFFKRKEKDTDGICSDGPRVVAVALRPWAATATIFPTEALPIGANGLRFHNGALWVSNFNKGTLLRVPVTATGTAGSLRVVAGGLPNIDDLSTSADGLASPSATAVLGDRLYVTGGGVPEPHDPKLQIARINFPAVLAGAAR
jgi:hypothetical protein